MTDGPKGHEVLLQLQIERYVGARQAWVQEAADVIAGYEGASIEQVLPFPMQEPGQARRDSEAPVLTDENEAKLREIAGRFGIGGEQDVSLEEAGLPTGHVAIVEAGLIWKMVAEDHLTGDAPSIYVYAGSPFERAKDTELRFQVERLGVDADNTAKTQYDQAKLAAESHPDYVAYPEPVDLGYGYNVDVRHETIAEPTGQFVQIGTRNGKPVVLFRTDREYYQTDEGETKYKNQPDTADIMGFVADVLVARGDTTTAVGLVTSNTYSSRVIDAVRAGLQHARQFGVAMYGRQTLAGVKGEAVTTPTELMQIPGDLRVIYFKLGQLLDAVRQRQIEE